MIYLDNRQTRNVSPSPPRQQPPSATQSPKSEPPKKNPKEIVPNLIKALNENNGAQAAEYAKNLAENGLDISFALKINTETDPKPTSKKNDEPVVEPIK